MDLTGSAFADPLWGINFFKISQRPVYEAIFKFRNTNLDTKMERPSIGPHWICFRRLLSWDKYIKILKLYSTVTLVKRDRPLPRYCCYKKKISSNLKVYGLVTWKWARCDGVAMWWVKVRKQLLTINLLTKSKL